MCGDGSCEDGWLDGIADKWDTSYKNQSISPYDYQMKPTNKYMKEEKNTYSFALRTQQIGSSLLVQAGQRQVFLGPDLHHGFQLRDLIDLSFSKLV